MPNFIRKRLANVIILVCLVLLLGVSKTYLIENSANDYIAPKNFRITSALPEIKNLKLMGSAQFSEQNLQYVLAHYPKPTYIIDLRQESHGFVNGIAISWQDQYNWANIKNTKEQNRRIENTLLQGLEAKHHIIINKVAEKIDGKLTKVIPINLTVRQVSNEQQLAEKHGIKYLRFDIPDHHRPNDLEVDRFVGFIRDTPSSEWLYFHCKAGKGRTTTFMTMTDMLRNAKDVSFEEIIRRQHALGGINLAKKKSDKPEILKEKAQSRLAFLREFYEYARAGGSQSWMMWLSCHSRESGNP